MLDCGLQLPTKVSFNLSRDNVSRIQILIGYNHTSHVISRQICYAYNLKIDAKSTGVGECCKSY